MKYLVFLWGLFWALPLNILPSFHGVKLDDLFLMLFLFLSLLNSRINDRLLIFVLLVTAYSTFYLLLSQNSMSHEPVVVYIRIIQSMLVVLFAYFLSKSHFKRAAFNGIILGGLISALLFFNFLASNIDTSLFITKGSYLVKDVFQYDDRNPFSIHVNSLSNLLMMCFFCSFWIYTKSSNRSYLIYSFVFLLVPTLMMTKGVILGLVLAFLIIGYEKLYRLYGRALIIVFILTGGLVFVFSLNYIHEFFSEFNINVSGRDNLYVGALRAFSDNFMGYGLDSQNTVLEQYTGINYPAHNFFLSVLLELGIFAFLFFLFVILGLFKHLINIEDKFSLAVFVAFFITGMFGNLLYFYKLHFFILCFTAYSGWLHVKKESTNCR